ncbi:MAG: hypothetical protein WA979_11615, partial [Pacificimonas sp.]
MKSFFVSLIERLAARFKSENQWRMEASLVASELRAVRQSVCNQMPEDIALYGYKSYSQNEEDGIIAEIFSRIGGGRTFIEIGVEDGTECNSHLLLLQGWQGIWYEANPESIASINNSLGSLIFENEFSCREVFVGPNNIVRLYQESCKFLKSEEIDFFSLDIDSYDLEVLKSLIRNKCCPKVICVEYNSKFVPPMRASVPFREDQYWRGNDYHGASLQSFVDLLASDYALITCDLNGANAFFVRNEFAALFPKVSPRDVWRPLRGHLAAYCFGHEPSNEFLRDHLNR